jgi:hypothetical protein
MEYDINDLTSIGVVRDTPPYMLPPEALTLGVNMRCSDGGLTRLLGWEQTFATPTVAPHFLMPVVTASGRLWLYNSLTRSFVYDGSSHTEITRVSGNYTTGFTQDWNGTLLANIPIINNGSDPPQSWDPATVGTKLIDLPNWPAGYKAKVVRAFGPFLVAIHITKVGTVNPHLVKWSNPATPGSVPASWDPANPANDAGENDLPDVQSGLLRDMLPLGDTMYIYKDSSTWKMRFVGGRFIFDFGPGAWLTSVGILAPRCVCVTGDGLRQVVVTQDDIIWHNGNTVRSILDKKQKKRLFNEMDLVNYQTSFLFSNPAFNEVWFCYPSAGQVQPDRALIMNYGEAGDEKWTVTEADGITFRHAAIGGVELASEEDWEANENEWDFDDGPWSELLRRRVVLAGTDAIKTYMLDRSQVRDGASFTSTVQRIGLALVGKKRNGNPIVDHQLMKMLTRMWPKIQGSQVNIRFGSQQVVDGPVTWGATVTYNPVTQAYADPGPVSGRAVGWEITHILNESWRLDGYKIEMMNLGNF